MSEIDVALLIIRLVLGLTLVVHGLNHLYGGGRIPGTARWFESLGLRPGIVHAWLSTATELAAGAGLALGLLTPFAAGASIGLMTVAGVVAHRRNGFFVFKEGYEYVLMIAFLSLALGVSGPGSASMDSALGTELSGFIGLIVALTLGLGGTAVLLLTAWRPSQQDVQPTATEGALL
jgi:putative oxidoreductase